MANIKISQLPSVTSLSGTEEFPIVSTGLVTSQVTSSVILNYVNGNITSLGTLSTLSATGNITGGNLSATNIVGTLTTASQTNITSVGTLGSLSVTGNVQSGNFKTSGLISATGNITGNYILGNGSQLSGINANYGNSNVTTLLAGLGSNAISTTGTIASGNITSGNVLTGGIISATGNITSGNVLGGANVNATSHTGTTVSVTANITGGNVLTGGIVSATGNITGNYFVGNGSQLTGLPATYGNANVATFLASFGSNSISTTGNVASGNLSVGSGTFIVGNIVTTGNVSGNIGSSSNYFNTVFATATTALYADLAENYLADADYAPGTVVVFGGDKEITVTIEAADERVAGVISTNPAYLMNSGELGLPVALRGKVPVRVVGPVTKGDSLVTSTTPGVAFSVGRERVYGQAVFAKSLESNDTDNEKVILAVII